MPFSRLAVAKRLACLCSKLSFSLIFFLRDRWSINVPAHYQPVPDDTYKIALREGLPPADALNIVRMGLKAVVREGRLVLEDIPVSLSEGTVVHLVLDDREDTLSDRERNAPHAVMARSWAQAESGQFAPKEAILAKLRSPDRMTKPVFHPRP